MEGRYEARNEISGRSQLLQTRFSSPRPQHYWLQMDLQGLRRAA